MSKRQSKNKAVRVYACPHCLEIFHQGTSPTDEIKENSESFLCPGCEDRVKVEVFDSKKEFKYFKQLYLATDYQGKPIRRVIHKEYFKFHDAVFMDPGTRKTYEAKKKKSPTHILICKAKGYKADITVCISNGNNSFEAKKVFDVKGFMNPRDTGRFNENCRLMKEFFGIDVEVLR